MRKVRIFFKNMLKVVLVIFVSLLVSVIEFFKSKTGIICLEAALVGFLAVYLMISLTNGTSKKGKYLIANKWRTICPWLETIWFGGILGLDFVLVEQILLKITI